MASDRSANIAPLTLTIEQAGELLGVGRSAMYAAVRRGEAPFPVIKVGRRRLASKHALEALLGPLDANGQGSNLAEGEKGADDAGPLQRNSVSFLLLWALSCGLSWLETPRCDPWRPRELPVLWRVRRRVCRALEHFEDAS